MEEIEEDIHDIEAIKENQFMRKGDGRRTQERDKSPHKFRGKRKRICGKKSCREDEQCSSSCSTSHGDGYSGQRSPKKSKLYQNFDANHFVILKGKEWPGIHQDPAYVTVEPYTESDNLEAQSERSTPELIAEMCGAPPAYSSKTFRTVERMKEKEVDISRKENQGKSITETNVSNTVTHELSIAVNPSCLILWKGNVNHGTYEDCPFVSVTPNLDEHSLGKDETCRSHSPRTGKDSYYYSSLDEEIELLERLQEKFKDVLERTSRLLGKLKKCKQRHQIEHKMGPGRGGAGGDFGKREGTQDGEDASDRAL